MPDPSPGERRRATRNRKPESASEASATPARIKRESLNLSLPPDLIAELYGLAALRGHGGRVSVFLEPYLRKLTQGMVHYERPAAAIPGVPGKGTEGRGGSVIEPPTLAIGSPPDDGDQPSAA